VARDVGIKELLEAGVHFGHQTRRWNPKMRRFIHGERGGIYIIDLLRTEQLLANAQRFADGVARRGGTVLFVGTKKQARDGIKEIAEAAGQPYVNHRWLGGLLTNYQTISLRIKRLHDLERYETEGQLQLLPTRERMAAQADLEKLRANLGGVKHMQRVPDALFVIDLKTEAIAVREAQRLRIPIIGLVDTNCDPDGIDYVIPGNDDAIKACNVITRAIGDTIGEGRATFRAEEERARQEAAEQARREAEEKARREAEEQARKEAELAAAQEALDEARAAARESAEASTAQAVTEAAPPAPQPVAAPAEAAPAADAPAPAETVTPAETPAPAETVTPAETPAPAEATETPAPAEAAETPAPAEAAETPAPAEAAETPAPAAATPAPAEAAARAERPKKPRSRARKKPDAAAAVDPQPQDPSLVDRAQDAANTAVDTAQDVAAGAAGAAESAAEAVAERAPGPLGTAAEAAASAAGAVKGAVENTDTDEKKDEDEK
jgi:small subunit ribosomal protein S2